MRLDKNRDINSIKNNQMKILVLNCGSSSIKYQLFDIDDNQHTVMAKGLLERIGLEIGEFTH